MRTDIRPFIAHFLILSLLFLSFQGNGQLLIDNSSTSYTIGFSGFDGSGFDPNPGTGQLDSDTWSLIGLSDGDLSFGGTGTSGDFARGSSTGGVTTAGIYAFDNGITGNMLGVQPGGSDFTPGEFRLRIENNSGDTLYEIELAYSVWVYNDQGRANKIELGYSSDNNSYTSIPALDVTSPEAADASPTWTEYKRDTNISGIDLAPGDNFYFRWRGDDVSGSGSRDEFGLDEINIYGFASSVNADLGMSEDTVCEGTLVDYSDSSSVTNDSIVSWEWDFGNGDTSMQQNPTYDHGNPGTYNIELKVTTDSGLVDSSSHTLLVNEADDASFHYDTTSYCDQDSDPTPTITGDAGGTFSEGSGGLAIDSNTGTIDLSASSSGTYSVFYETDGECANASTFELEVVDQYDASIDPVGTLCDQPSDSIDLTAPHEGGQWSGPGIVDDSTGAFDPSIAGVGTHQVTHSIDGPCGDADTIDIEVTGQLDATIDSVGTYCLPSVTDVLDAADNGGVWSGPGIIDTTTGEFSPNDAGEGTHTIVYEISGTCGDIDSIDVQVDSSEDATIDPAGPFCEKTDTVQLTTVDTSGTWSGNGIVDTAEGEFLPAEAGPGTHTVIHSVDGECGDVDSESIEVFNSKDGEIDSTGPYCVLDASDTLQALDTGGVWSGPGIVDSTNGVFDPDSAGPGVHQIVHSFENIDSCGIDDTTSIEVLGIPDASIDSVGAVCINEGTLTLSAADTGGTWSGPGIVDPQAGTFSPNSAGLGTHSIEYHVQESGACEDTDSVEISVVGAPTADFDWSNNGTTVSFSDSSNGSTGQYWEFGDGDSSSDQNPTHTYGEDSLYTACLHVFDDNSCSDTICQTIDLQDVSIEEHEKEKGRFGIRPNPSSKRVEVLLSKELHSQKLQELQLLDLSGRMIRRKDLRAGEGQKIGLDVSELRSGTYFIRVRTEEGSLQRKLIVR